MGWDFCLWGGEYHLNCLRGRVWCVFIMIWGFIRVCLRVHVYRVRFVVMWWGLWMYVYRVGFVVMWWGLWMYVYRMGFVVMWWGLWMNVYRVRFVVMWWGLCMFIGWGLWLCGGVYGCMFIG